LNNTNWGTHLCVPNLSMEDKMQNKLSAELFIKSVTYNGEWITVMGIVTMPGMDFSNIRTFFGDDPERGKYLEQLKSILSMGVSK